MNNRRSFSDPHEREEDLREQIFRKALRTASNILGYAECSPKRLSEKLRMRDYDEETIEAVLARLAGAGLLDEEKMATRRAEYLYRVKGYGPRRILPELFRLGFSRAVISALSFPEDTFDFPSRCAEHLLATHKKAPIAFPLDPKIRASLARLGYTDQQIRAAERMLLSEKHAQDDPNGQRN